MCRDLPTRPLRKFLSPWESCLEAKDMTLWNRSIPVLFTFLFLLLKLISALWRASLNFQGFIRCCPIEFAKEIIDLK